MVAGSARCYRDLHGSRGTAGGGRAARTELTNPRTAPPIGAPSGVHVLPLVGSAIAAAYTAGAMMLEGAAGRVILPLGKYEREANIPGARVTIPIELEHGEVGVRHGQ